MYDSKTTERFWAKVDIRNQEDCWPWLGSLNRPNGYGCFRILGKTKGAHRVSFEMRFGEIANGLFVMHTCDNPPCVNPNHLILGTNHDNVLDRMRKQRHCKSFGIKIPLEDRTLIIQRYNSGESIDFLASEYDVTEARIHQIIKS
jgi:hypothetical protein